MAVGIPLVANVNRVIVELDEAPKETPGGIVLPENYDQKRDVRSFHGTIVAVGPQKLESAATIGQYAHLKVGVRCFIGSYSGIGISWAGKEYRVVEHQDVLATH